MNLKVKKYDDIISANSVLFPNNHYFSLGFLKIYLLYNILCKKFKERNKENVSELTCQI